MARYKKQEFCKNHPDRKTHGNRNVCHECHLEYMREWRANNTNKLNKFKGDKPPVRTKTRFSESWKRINKNPSNIIYRALIAGC